MKIMIVSLACCALVAPLAFGKDSKKKAMHMGVLSAERAVTVTAPNNNMKAEGGEVTGYQPAGMLVVRQNGPGYFVLDEPGRIFNRRGEAVTSAIRPGTQVQVYFAGDGASKAIDHVVVY